MFSLMLTEIPGSLVSDTSPTLSGVLDILSGDHRSSSVREKGSPALQYLLQISQEPAQVQDSQLRPGPWFENKHNFFSSLKFK